RMDESLPNPPTPAAGLLDASPRGTSTWSQLLAPFRPPFETARHYNLHKFRKDILAGMTVSVVEVPQAMAYALLAGVPPQDGIYSSVIPGALGEPASTRRQQH